jgi:hypothetical protein
VPLIGSHDPRVAKAGTYITTETFNPSPLARGRVALVDATSQNDGRLVHATLMVETVSGVLVELERIEVGKLRTLCAEAERRAEPRS